MKKILLALSVVCWMSGRLCAQEAEATGEPSVLEKVKWVKGPATGELGSVAKMAIPEGHLFAGGDDTRLLMEAMKNPVSGNEVGFLAPEDMDWFLVFEYENSGYVKDDEKDSLDAAAMLKSIQAGNEAGNEERKKKGWPTLNITGWQQPPVYNKETHNLEWAINAESEGSPVINFNTRLLGREGVMQVTVIASPENYLQALAKYRNVITGFDYKEGQRYAEYRQGDKLAKYGLAALVVGGASAVAVQSGLVKYIWKILVIGAVAVGAFFKKLFGRNKPQS